MPLIQLQGVTKHYGAQTMLDVVSWGIESGQHVGLIGANGTGKTTILRLITGSTAPDAGEVTHQQDCRIGYLTQDPDFDPACTLLDEALRGLSTIHELERELRTVEQALAQPRVAEEASKRLLARYGRLLDAYERAGGYAYRHRAEAVLYGLGFTSADFAQPVRVLSGGQKTRLGLAKLLLSEADVLLLDEPESHLDMEATEWLERYIGEYRGAVLLVSHDRYFLDRTVDHIVELSRKTLFTYPGNYSRYLALKEERQLAQQRAYEAQQAMIARTEEFIRRNIAGQKTKQARGRRKMLERLERIDPPAGDGNTAGIRFATITRTGDEVAILDRVSKRYGDRLLFTDLSLRLFRGERLGVIGPNGCGKTTLLRLILEREKPTSGSVRLGANVRIGYYDQERAGLSRDRNVLHELWSVRPTLDEESVRNMLGRFLFSGDDVFKQVGKLSGGEQGRLTLAKLMLDEPNVLVLDEPTNHLDIPSRHAFEQALQTYTGTILVVSHDRYFLDRAVQSLLVFEPDGPVRWEGDYSSYRAYKERRQPPDKEIAAVPQKSVPLKDKSSKNKPEERQLKQRRKTAETLEQAIQEKEEEIGRLERELNDERVYTDPARVADAGRAYTQAKTDLDALYTEWETITRELERMA